MPLTNFDSCPAGFHGQLLRVPTSNLGYLKRISREEPKLPEPQSELEPEPESAENPLGDHAQLSDSWAVHDENTV